MVAVGRNPSRRASFMSFLRGPRGQRLVATVVGLFVQMVLNAPAPASELAPEPWAGGPSYWSQFPQTKAAGWDNPAFFPIAVWFAGVGSADDAATDRAAGLNTYIWLTGNSDVTFIRSADMFLIDQQQHRVGRGRETIAFGVEDEGDMKYGPGDAEWSGVPESKSCRPVTAGCGYTAIETLAAGFPKDGHPLYANVGKGVMFWQTDAQAARFVNHVTHFISADMYWYSDNDSCIPSQGGHLIKGGWDRQLSALECHRASNYGITVDRMRKLDAMDGKLQPVFSFVEDGHPGSGKGPVLIDGPELQGAVMSSLIHGAAGIIYFNHSFGGPCISANVMRDKCGAEIRPYIVEINRIIKELAPVLNTQSLSWNANPRLDTMLKRDASGTYYLFAQQNLEATGTYELSLPTVLASAGAAEVLYENRVASVTDGKLRDSFAAEYSWHVYKFSAR